MKNNQLIVKEHVGPPSTSASSLLLFSVSVSVSVSYGDSTTPRTRKGRGGGGIFTSSVLDLLQIAYTQIDCGWQRLISHASTRIVEFDISSSQRAHIPSSHAACSAVDLRTDLRDALRCLV
ncbi:hypothetical protein EW145_g1388 [Phellinidium pouzarii]|uniref:Uncharacterized protein n=1 Tax=Phellinidium pouzarii TaxID=167371 RepID=A0A4S4LF98_9AGAM|nr:hypothetical protein EW145_g1388 [Phellinidium pouzarii]